NDENSRQNIARHRPRRKTAMTTFVSTLRLVLLCSTIFLGSSTLAAARESSLDGIYILDETDSDNMNEVIEDAVGKLNFLTRDIARGRLKKRAPDCLKLSRTNKFTDESPERGCRRICCPSNGTIRGFVILFASFLTSTFPVRGTLPYSSGVPGRSGCSPLSLSGLGWWFVLPR